MTTPLSPAQAKRRYVALTAIRWLPVGLYAPLTVLLMLDRGLSLAEVGLAMVPYGVAVVVLELPTGGLADSLGRKPVLVTAAVVEAISLLMKASAGSLVAFAVASAVSGAARALSSGPLEAWYVDTVHEARDRDERRDGRRHGRHRAAGESLVQRGLAAGGTAEAASLAVGAGLAGLLPPLLTELPADLADRIEPLAVPLIVGAGFSLVHALALLLWLREPRRSRRDADAVGPARPPGPARLASAGARLSMTDGGLRRLLLAAFGIGIALSAFELLWQPRFVELLGWPAEDAAALLGPLLAATFAAAALGSAIAPAMSRLFRGPARAAGAAVAVHAISLTVAGLTRSPVFAAACFLLAYFANGWHWPLHHDLLHARVTAAHRTVALSVSSLVLRGGGMLTDITFGALAMAAGVPLAWALAGVLLLITGSWVLQVPARSAKSHDQREGGRREMVDGGQGERIGQALAASSRESNIASSRESMP